MSCILVAEDSATQAANIRFLLQGAGYEVQTVPDGQQALDAIQQQLPDLVLTDLDMPHVTGLQLVQYVRERHPRLPVVLMTAFGTDETAVQALEPGAASYVPKRNLQKDLVSTISDVLSIVENDLEQARVAEHLLESDASFCLHNDAQLIGPVVAYLQDSMESLSLIDATQRLRVGVALEEALRSALVHGNLELSAQELREAQRHDDGGQSYRRLIEERQQQSPYCDRRIHVHARMTREESVCTVRDEGAGIASRLPAHFNDATHLAEDENRGLLLMKTFMDEVRFSDSGHEITLIKKAAQR